MFVNRMYDRSAFSLGLSAASLTNREKQVLQILVEGRSNKEIARPLGIEERTVKAHISKMMRKIGVANRVAVSTYAISRLLVGHNGPPQKVS
jgi:DNA-binding NarL/FixJ family response regulator